MSHSRRFSQYLGYDIVTSKLTFRLHLTFNLSTPSPSWCRNKVIPSYKEACLHEGKGREAPAMSEQDAPTPTQAHAIETARLLYLVVCSVSLFSFSQAQDCRFGSLGMDMGCHYFLLRRSWGIYGSPHNANRCCVYLVQVFNFLHLLSPNNRSFSAEFR